MIALHSDDFGYKTYSDKKILRLLRLGRIKSVSILINMCENSSLRSLVKLVNSNPGIKVGLHLNLVEGRSMEQKAYIPSLVSGRNKFFSLKKFTSLLFLHLINPGHIEREIKVQVNALKRTGLKISFIDSHQHLHAVSPIAEIVEKVAEKEKITVVRSYKNIKTYTLMAKMKYLILKLIAYCSHLLIYGKVGLPVTWNMQNRDSYSFMSWESTNFDITSIKDKKLIFVAHPFLPFDSNTSYMWTF